MPFEYDASASYLVTALQFSHTVVPSVVQRPTFWLFFLLHLAVFSAFQMGYLQSALEDHSMWFIDWKIISVITSMTTFFEVFYTNNVFSRYVRLYTWTRQIIGALPNFAFDMRIHAGDTNQPMVRLACRYFIASTFLFFYSLNGEISEPEWTNLTRNKLIFPEEVEVLSKFEKQHVSAIVLHWAGRVVRETVLQVKAPNNIIKGLIDRLVRARENEQVIQDTLRLPMPFQYFHLLNMMVVVNLLLWAYGMGVTHSIFAPVGFFFAELIFCGMMELAGQMSDPFGYDEVDFPLHHWLANALWDASVILEYDYDIGKGGFHEMAKVFPPLDHTTIPIITEVLVTKGSLEGGSPTVTGTPTTDREAYSGTPRAETPLLSVEETN
mmetsp:Transcript_18164/g.38839  ORF Transcript_18164/g.38839 Transcript_18164/m.38839 type:complete len:381 (+) Transcript_18164:239-1381(+)